MKANTSKTELTMDELVAKLNEQGTVFKVSYGFMHMEHDAAELAAALFLASPISTSIKAAKTKEDLYDKCWCFEYSKEPMFR